MLPDWAKCIIRLLQYGLFLLVWPYSLMVSLFRRKRHVPPARNQILFYSATELANLIRTQKISCRTVIEAYINRIKEVQPFINSVVQDRFEEALKDADLVDSMVEKQPDPDHWSVTKPLLGVPLTVKESVGVKGMSNKAGLPNPFCKIAEKDSIAVENLREAGAIPLLVSNTPELCLFWESNNSVTGTTNNPFNTRRVAGGSSGGECALISSAASVIGIGSDIVGSGRIPALFCGTFGHKPTPGFISVEGHMPSCDDPEWSSYLTLSPIARYAEDLPLIMKAASPEARKTLRLDEPVDIKKVRVFYLKEHRCVLNSSVDRDIKQCIDDAISHLENVCSVSPQLIDLPELDDALEVVCTIFLRMDSPDYIFQKSSNRNDWTFGDTLKVLLKKFLGCSNHMMHSIFYGVIKKLAEKLSPEREAAARRFKEEWQKRIQDILKDDGVLILPVFPHTAMLHYQLYYKMTDCSYVAAFNLLEMPSTAVPMGCGSNGLPVGFQVAAAKNQDRLTFAVAKELESGPGGWVPPGEKAARVVSA